MKHAPVDKAVFWPALLVVIGAVIPLILYPDQSAEVLGRVLDTITNKLGFLFLWFTIACFALLMWFAFGRYGRVRFGGEDARPEFRSLSSIRVRWRTPSIGCLRFSRRAAIG